MTIELLFVIALATYRLTLLINKEDGPWDILGHFRSWVGVTYDQYSNPVGTNGFSRGLLCPYCLSMWVGIGVGGYTALAILAGYPGVAFYTLLPFALSGAAVFLFKWAGT